VIKMSVLFDVNRLLPGIDGFGQENQILTGELDAAQPYPESGAVESWFCLYQNGERCMEVL